MDPRLNSTRPRDARGGNTHNSRVSFAVNFYAATFANAPGASHKLTARKLHSRVFPLLASRLRTAVVPFVGGILYLNYNYFS